MAKYWDYIKNGFYESAGENRTEITDEYWQQLLLDQSNGKRIVTSNNRPISVENNPTLEELMMMFRGRREKECFRVVNRGMVWYETLSDIQKKELKDWYIKWLNVTDTKIIPDKPKWL